MLSINEWTGRGWRLSHARYRIVDLFPSRLNDLSLEELIPSVTKISMLKNAKTRLTRGTHNGGMDMNE